MAHVQWLIYCVISARLVVTVPANINLTTGPCHPLMMMTTTTGGGGDDGAGHPPTLYYYVKFIFLQTLPQCCNSRTVCKCKGNNVSGERFRIGF